MNFYLVGYEALRRETCQGFLIYSLLLHVHEAGIHVWIQNSMQGTLIVHGISFIHFKMYIKMLQIGKRLHTDQSGSWLGNDINDSKL
jgi:hypothetical protein